MKKILLIINTSLFIISLSISIVLLFRPFYYSHINYLKLENKTGYTYQEIKESYDDVINYLTLNKDFKTGKLKYSLEGKKHFYDCKILFTINFIILGISSLIILLNKKGFKIKTKKYNIRFYSSLSLIIIFILSLISYLILGFDKLFILFHKVFFFGRDNWLLDPNYDEIIYIFPVEFFRNCLIFILSMISIISIINIIRGVKYEKNKNIFNN